MPITIFDISAALAAYLLGAIPFGLVVTRLLGGPDPRGAGSGNIGATNVTRLAGKKAGVLTLLLDAAKGYLPTALALAWMEPRTAAMAGLAAFLGHCYSPYLRFKGGKGVATFLGVVLAVSPWAGLGVILVIAGLAGISGYVSVGSIGGCLSGPLWLFVLGQGRSFVIMAVAMCAVVLWRHRENLARLMRGGESSWRKPN